MLVPLSVVIEMEVLAIHKPFNIVSCPFHRVNMKLRFRVLDVFVAVFSVRYMIICFRVYRRVTTLGLYPTYSMISISPSKGQCWKFLGIIQNAGHVPFLPEPEGVLQNNRMSSFRMVLIRAEMISLPLF